MVKFEYRDITIEFQSWYDAASWLYYQWNEKENERVRHMIDSSASYFMDFTAWVNDNYTPYDILSRCNDDLYVNLFEQYLFDLADDLQYDIYDFCAYFTEVEEEKPQPDLNKKYYKIMYSCGCGENEEYISAETDKEAEKYAYEMAVEDYHSYEGYHGIRTLEEIAVELFDVEDESDLTEDQLMDAEDSYFDEIESTIYWNYEKVSFEEYLENDGRVI
jgi:hypothetical protein